MSLCATNPSPSVTVPGFAGDLEDTTFSSENHFQNVLTAGGSDGGEAVHLTVKRWRNGLGLIGFGVEKVKKVDMVGEWRLWLLLVVKK
ncbi:hypothetical protein Hanom_Chr15g01385081 [Helianthus anomalus]